MPAWLDPWSALAVERLAAASWRGAVVIGVVWIVCRYARLVPAARPLIWWGASLALVLALVPLPSIPLPILPPPAADLDQPSAPPERLAHAEPPPLGSGPAAGAIPGPVRQPQTWTATLALVWILGVLAGCGRLAAACRRVRGIVRRALPIDAGHADLAARLSAALGLRRVPPVRTSAEIASPQVAGAWRPVVLLPAEASRWSDEDRRMALCHELLHVRRRDLLAGWVPALAERLFFYHPLARLVAREYAIAREAACDAAVLQVLGVEASQYGRLLVRMGVVGPAAVSVAGGGASSASVLRRRLTMLNECTPHPRGGWSSLWLAAAMGVMLAPVQFVAAAGAPPAQVPSSPEVEIYVMNADGTNLRGLTNHPDSDIAPEVATAPPQARPVTPELTAAAEARPVVRARAQERPVERARAGAGAAQDPAAEPSEAQPPADGGNSTPPPRRTEITRFRIFGPATPQSPPQDVLEAQRQTFEAQRQALDAQRRALEIQRDAIARAVEEMSRARERLAAQQQELDRRREALVEAIERLTEREAAEPSAADPQ